MGPGSPQCLMLGPPAQTLNHTWQQRLPARQPWRFRAAAHAHPLLPQQGDGAMGWCTPGAERKADGTVVGSMRPEQVAHDDPLAGCDRATSIILFQMDVIHGLTLSEG